ncbi:hypothetical protein LMG19144_00699 [Xanthomonas arboricola pv. fragariae]|nr:hypothetical protein LMG19144_00699 [Xanthomonas arboricola pv. fragariae]
MTAQSALLGLGISTPHTDPNGANFVPPTWPPAADYPVTIDATESVVSRYGDPTWILTPWTGKASRVNFGDGPAKGKAKPISPVNAGLLRLLCAWWLWGPSSVRTGGELLRRFELVRPLFVLCSEKGISAAELSAHPHVRHQLSSVLHKSQRRNLISIFHNLYDCRDTIGFVLLEPAAIAALAAAIPNRESAQTAYIPPRIWLYQLSRLRECLDDFIAHERGIVDLYEFSIQAYEHNARNDLSSRGLRPRNTRRPFTPSNTRLSGLQTGCIFHGEFSQAAKKYGVYDLLNRWVGNEETGIQHATALSKYLTLTTYVGCAYLLNFSMMRIDEGWSLRSSCLAVERDDSGEDVFLLRGRTTKTTYDEDARWITSPSCTVALAAMQCVARLRTTAAQKSGLSPVTSSEADDPFLAVRAYEPWASRNADVAPSILPLVSSYDRLSQQNPKLFDLRQLEITRADLEDALLFTPTLDPQKFAVGKPWPLAWHQLRRTGAVNMAASGLVSDSSVQYQLKHASRAMSRYYSQGCRHVSIGLSPSARDEFIRAMYEAVSRQLLATSSARFLSPYGEKHKLEILKLVSSADHGTLISHARAGRVAYREHLLGACLNPSPCDKGGVESIAPCGGLNNGRPCNFLVYDRAREARYVELQRVIRERLTKSEPGSPLQESLNIQLNVIEGALHAIEAD